MIQPAHPLDDPPPFHRKLLDYGERPYWTNDGTRVCFMASNYGDACEIDIETGVVRDLTRGLGPHHAFLRVLVLSNDDYLLVGPRERKAEPFVSRRIDNELWVLDKSLMHPPKPLGRTVYEGVGVSTIAPRITYSRSGRNDPAIGRPDSYECHVTDIVYGEDGPELGPDRVFYRTGTGVIPEPQDFRHDDNEVLFAEYSMRRELNVTPDAQGTVRGCRLDTGEVTTYLTEAYDHNEPEGIFPDHEHISVESSCTLDVDFPSQDLWKLKLDGSQRRVRMTSMPEDFKATNCNVSPDGRWLAFMVALQTDEPGFGRGLGLLDLEAWGRSPQAQQWETPTSRARARLGIEAPEDALAPRIPTDRAWALPDWNPS